MPELRNTIKRELIDTLDSTCFTSDDFSLAYGDNPNNLLFEIVFIHDKKFKFTVKKVGDREYGVERIPGEIEKEDYTREDHFTRILSLVNDWANEVRNELKAEQPIYREIDELRASVEQSIKSSFADRQGRLKAEAVSPR